MGWLSGLFARQNVAMVDSVENDCADTPFDPDYEARRPIIEAMAEGRRLAEAGDREGSASAWEKSEALHADYIRNKYGF